MLGAGRVRASFLGLHVWANLGRIRDVHTVGWHCLSAESCQGPSKRGIALVCMGGIVVYSVVLLLFLFAISFLFFSFLLPRRAGGRDSGMFFLLFLFLFFCQTQSLWPDCLTG